MTQQLLNRITDFAWNLPAPVAALDPFRGRLPDDYLKFLSIADGGEGFLDEDATYAVLWRAEELEPFNADYQVAELAPGLLLIGSNGGGEGFGFDLRSERRPMVQVPFIGMSWKDAWPVARTFTEFLSRTELG